MYFENRNSAGNILAEQLFEKYRYEDCAVIALNEGGVLVGEPIAAALHSVLTLLLSEDVEIPGESLSLGNVSQNGNFLKNSFASEQILRRQSNFYLKTYSCKNRVCKSF